MLNTVGTASPKRLADAPMAIIGAIVVAALTPVIMTMTPVIVEAFMSGAYLSNQQAGVTASVETGGILVATLCFAILSTRVRYSRLAMIGLVLFASANLVSIKMASFGALTGVRFVAGFGAGLAISAGFGALALTKSPDRWFGWLNAAVLGYASVGLWLAPSMGKADSYSALMLLFAAAGIAALFGACYMVDGAVEYACHADETSAVPLMVRLSAIGCIFLFSLGFSTSFTYMALVGEASGLSDNQNAIALTSAELVGIVASVLVAVFATPIEHKLGRRLVIGAIVVMGTGGTALLVLHQSFWLFCVLNGVFQFSWNAGQPALMGALSGADQSGRLVVVSTPFQFAALALGPMLAALLIIGGYAAVSLVSAAIIATTLLPLWCLTRPRHAS